LSNFFDYRYLNILSDGPQVGPVAFSVPACWSVACCTASRRHARRLRPGRYRRRWAPRAEV